MQARMFADSPGNRRVFRNRRKYALDKAISASLFNLEGLESRVLMTASAGLASDAVASDSVTPQNGTGLLAVYYNNADFTAPIVTRVDSTLNIDCSSGAPAPGLATAGYSVEWTGKIVPPVSGVYEFDVTTRGGLEMWLGGRNILNDSTIHSTALDTGQYMLVGGQPTDIRIDLATGSQPGLIQFAWTPPNQLKQLVPTAQLFVPATAPTAPTALTAAAAAGQVMLSWSGDSGATSYDIYRGTSAGGESQTPYAVGVTGETFTDTAVSDGTAYYYTVASVNATGVSGISPEATATTPAPIPPVTPPPVITSVPSAPGALTADFVGNGISLNWTAVPGATSYTIYRSSSSTTGGSVSGSMLQTGVTATSYLDTDIAGQTIYTYVVIAANSMGAGNPSPLASVTTPALPPGAPASLRTTIAGAGVRLNWNRVGQATSYDVYRGPASGQESSTPLAVVSSGFSFVDSSLAPGQLYFYIVTAVNSAGQSEDSPEAIAVVPWPAPSAPATLAAVGASSGIQLSWTAAANAVSYNIYRGTSSGGESPTPLQTGVLGANFTDASAAPGITYFYTVTAVNPTAQSGASSEAFAAAPIPIPAAPATLSASPTASGVSLNWSAVPYATSYDLYRGTAGGQESATPIQTGLTGTSFTDASAGLGQTYYYYVTAVDSSGQGTASSEASATMQPAAPVTLSAAPVSNGIQLNWSSVNGATSYDIYRGAASGGESSTPIQTGLTGNSFTDSSAAGGVTYFYTVTAVNATAQGSASPEASAAAPIPIPGAPLALSTSPVFTGISLNWSSVAGAKTYDIYRGSVSGQESATPVQMALTGTSFTDTSVAFGQTYFYYVTALNGGGQGTASPEAAGTMRPAASTNLNAALTGNGIQLNWASVSGATSYNIYRGTSSNGESSTPFQTLIVGSTFTDTSVNSGTTYYYKMMAVNAGGISAASSEASATTPTLPGLPTPAGVSATATSTSDVTVSWSDVAGESGFTLLRSTDGVNFTQTLNVAGGVTNYVDDGLAAGSRFYYEVIADGAAGASPASAPVSVMTPTAWVGTTQPAPAPSGGWTTTSPAGLITPQSNHRSNIFYVDASGKLIDPVTFQLGGNPVSYQVRDYDGNLVDSGPASANTTLNVSQPGWYKLYVYGPNTTAQFGNIIGTSTFVIFRNDPNFPQLTDLYAGTYNTGETFIQQVMARVDPTVNFNWTNTSPTPALQTTNFAVVWTGQVQAQYSETYTFSTNSDDGVRLWVNGQEIINDWTAHGATVDTASVTLVAGQRYNIKMEYYQALFASVASLSWSSPSTPQQIIPSSVLYPTVTATSPGGLTGTYYNGLTSSDGSEDQVIRAITAMGPERYNVQDVSNPAQVIAMLQADITAANALYTTGANHLGPDPMRPRALMVAFTNGTQNLAAIKQIVTALQGSVTYWEGQNEPNYGYSGQAYVPIEQAFYNTVKSVNPNLKVIGPTTVSVDNSPNGLQWLDQFFSAGGSHAIDALSFHAYNNVLGSLTLARSSMNGLMTLLNKYGLGNIELWQTEQGSFASVYGDYEPRLQGRWTMMEQMVFEQYNLPKEHNFIWYDHSMGFWDQPVWWENDDGTLNPAAPLMRVFSEELFGTKFTSAYNFGQYANDLYIGSLFSGPNKSVAAFMSGGQSDGQITLNVSGGTTLHVVSAFGVAQDLPVVNGQVQLSVPEIPVYVEMAQGQTISVVPQNWGPDLALQPGTAASYSGANNNGINKIIDGKFQDYYDNQNSPWGDLNYTDPNGWVQISLPSVQTVSRVNIFAMRPWQLSGTLMDFEVQYFNNATNQWTTLEHVKQQPETFGVFSPVTRTTADSYFDDQFIFQEHFSPVQTSKIRLLIHGVSYGGGATQLVPLSGGQASMTPTLTLSEIELFGS